MWNDGILFIGRLELSFEVGKLDLAETDTKNLAPDCKPFDVRCLHVPGQLEGIKMKLITVGGKKNSQIFLAQLVYQYGLK